LQESWRTQKGCNPCRGCITQTRAEPAAVQGRVVPRLQRHSWLRGRGQDLQIIRSRGELHNLKADPCGGCILNLSFSLCSKTRIQHCKSHGVLNENADPKCGGCSSVRSCRSATAENTCYLSATAGKAPGSADAARSSGSSSGVAENSNI